MKTPLRMNSPSGDESGPGEGFLPAWQVDELPAPPPWTLGNVFRVIGPGAILLGASVGGGEWLLGPTAIVKYGAALLWVTTIAVILQTFLNMELVRYTLYTGEPILTGAMRTWPGPTFWGWVYSILIWFQVCWPSMAGTAAAALVAGFLGRLPSEETDAGLLFWVSSLLLVGSGAVLLLGEKVERTLELLNWFMVSWVLIFMSVAAFILVPWSRWSEIFVGYLSFGTLPQGADWFLMAAFAASSGAGGAANIALSNWFRDKGFGMGGQVGYIPSPISRQEIRLAHSGKIFKIDAASLSRWKGWWRYVKVDQIGVFMAGAFLGMSLPVVLALEYLPAGEDLRGLAVSARLADGLAASGGPVLWMLTLICGFWILFSTQIGVFEAFIRIVTDILWTGNRRVRKWKGQHVRRLYSALLVLYLVWGLLALQWAQPIFLFQLATNVAALITVMLSLHTLYVNRTLLPPPLRPSWWRQLMLAACAVFYGFFVILSFSQMTGILG